MFPTKFRFIWPSSFREKKFRNRPIRNKNCLWRPYLFMDRDEIINLYTGPSKDAPCYVSIHLAKRFQRRFFRNQPIRNKNGLWWPFLLMDQDEMNNLYKRTCHRCFLPSFGSFGQAVSEEKICKNRPIRNKNCLWRPCLVMDNKMCTLCRVPSKDVSYQVSVHLAKQFQREKI